MGNRDKLFLLLGMAFWIPTLRQGLVLGMLLAWISFGIAKRSVKPSWGFTPYWVSVAPNWYEILTDFRLIGNPKEWRAIEESVRSCPDYRVLRDDVIHGASTFRKRNAQPSILESTPVVWEQMSPLGEHDPNTF